MRYRIFAIGWLLTLLAAACPAVQPDFAAALPALKAARSGDAPPVWVKVGDREFTVNQSVSENIPEARARALMGKDPEPSDQPRYEDGRFWVQFDAKHGRTVEQPMPTGPLDKLPSWRLQQDRMIAKYPNSRWTAFVDVAIGNGLIGFEDYRLQDATFRSLWMAPPTRRTLLTNVGPIKVPRQFDLTMRLSPRYAITSGPNGFVLLIHDPHQNVLGRYQTLNGVHDLIAANPDRSYQFLVEGRYIDTGRRISLPAFSQPLDGSGAGDTTVVHRLLATFAINVPTAYRMLYGHSIPAHAIDDNDALVYDKPISLRDRLSRIETLEELRRFASQLMSSDPIQAIALESSAQRVETMSMARPDSRNERAYLEMLRLTHEAYQNIVQSLAGLAAESSDVDQTLLTTLRADERAFADLVHVDKVASDRSRVMAREIATRVAGSSDVCIAFIGSYHTGFITASLKKQGIGYAVIEPRTKQAPSPQENDAFLRMNHLNTRSQALVDMRLNTGFSELAPEEIARINPQAARASLEAATLLSSNRARLQAVSGGHIDAVRLLEAIGANGQLSNATVMVDGGGGTPPPEDFRRAFAFFEPPRSGGRGPGDPAIPGSPPGDGKGGGNFGVLHLLLADDPRWDRAERYELLRRVSFLRQQERPGYSVTRQAMQIEDPTTGRLITLIYDGASGRTYCIDANDLALRSVMGADAGPKDSDQRTQVVETSKEKQHG